MKTQSKVINVFVIFWYIVSIHILLNVHNLTVSMMMTVAEQK